MGAAILEVVGVIYVVPEATVDFLTEPLGFAGAQQQVAQAQHRVAQAAPSV